MPCIKGKIVTASLKVTTGVPKHLLDGDLANALYRFGLDASVKTESHNPANSQVSIKVPVGKDTVALVTESTDGFQERARAEKAAQDLLKHKNERCVVTVCYADDASGGSIEESRYAWRVIRKPVKDSDWMMGGIADLAFTVALSLAGPREPGDAARTLVNYLVECNAGVLVKALPISAATSQFSVAVRQLLAEAFQVDFIVSSHDPKRAHFSEKGKTPEVLLICRARIFSPEVPSATRVINLAGNPSTPEEAQVTAASIADCIDSSPASMQSFGSIQKIGSAELYEGDWGAVHFLSPFLREQFRKLRHDDKVLYDSSWSHRRHRSDGQVGAGRLLKKSTRSRSARIQGAVGAGQ